MKLVKCLFVLLFITPWQLYAQEQALYDSANAAYARADYQKAIELYDSILASGKVSAQVYYNLGNAYLKINRIGLSILNYERAKRLNPTDDDILYNLKIANQRTDDKIDEAPQLFLSQWKKGITRLMSEKAWSIISIVFFFLSLVFIFLYISATSKLQKQIGFFIGLFFLLSSLCFVFIAQQSYQIELDKSEAIIITPSVTVVSSPTQAATKIFIIHEGTKVNVLEKMDDWMEVKIANGNTGWVKSNQLISI